MTRQPAPLPSNHLPRLSTEVRSGLLKIYADLDRALQQRDLHCCCCGKCCRLTEWGHELWITQLEFALLTEHWSPPKSMPDGVCPFMNGEGQCTARERRTLGCRIFFCEQRDTDLEDLYAVYLDRIVKLAKSHGLELHYGELLSSLVLRSA